MKSEPFMTTWVKVLLTFLLAFTIFLLDLSIPLGVAGGVPYVAFVLMGLIYNERRVSIMLGVIATLLTILGQQLSPSGGEEWKVLINRSYAIFAIWAVAIGVHQQKKALGQLEEYALKLKESKTDLERKVKERTKELNDALNYQKELSDMRSRFISVASHEFRTPLSTILSSISLLDRYTGTDENEKRVKHINRIKSSIQKLTSILDDFFSLTEMEKGQRKPESNTFDITELSKKIIEEVSVLKKIGQEIDYDHVGPAVVSNLDLSAIYDIITNLVTNAIKFSPVNKLIHLETMLSNEQVLIKVVDRGVGIPKHEQKYVFDMFFRAENVVNLQGKGLGLNIVKRHVKMMNGTISLLSELENGTTFTVQLPTPVLQMPD